MRLLVQEEIEVKIKEIKEAMTEATRPKKEKKNNNRKKVQNVVRQNIAEMQPDNKHQH